MNMLITKEVEVLLASRVIKYYENLGYNIPREERLYGTSKALAVPHGTRINVKVEDLPSQSNIDVECECDGCGIILKMPYCNYTKYNHEFQCISSTLRYKPLLRMTVYCYST